MSALYDYYAALRAAMPPRPPRWGEAGLSDRPISTPRVPAKRKSDGGWHRDKATLRKLK